jgi:hypothetical protein
MISKSPNSVSAVFDRAKNFLQLAKISCKPAPDDFTHRDSL